MEKDIDIYIILVLLPDNDTHSFQPLAIAVFEPFKKVLKLKMDNFIIDKACTVLLKNDKFGNNIGRVGRRNFYKEEEYCSRVLKQWHLTK